MRNRSILTVVALMVTPLALVAQNPPNRGAQPQPPDHAMRLERMQEMQRHMEQLMTRLKETNQWMVQQRTHEHFRNMGQQMEQAGDRLREMLRTMDRLHQDGGGDRDRDRIRDMDQLRDRLRDMQRDLDQAHDALRKMIRKP